MVGSMKYPGRSTAVPPQRIRAPARLFGALARSYRGCVVAVALTAVGLSFLMPSTMGRVLLLTPIVLGLAGRSLRPGGAPMARASLPIALGAVLANDEPRAPALRLCLLRIGVPGDHQRGSERSISAGRVLEVNGTETRITEGHARGGGTRSPAARPDRDNARGRRFRKTARHLL